MKTIYKKSELGFALGWIAAYCVLMSSGDILSERAGTADSVTLPIAVIMSVIIYFFIKKNGLKEKYGLCKAKIPSGKMLYYIPLIMILPINFIYGIWFADDLIETILYFFTMLFVGFLEEIIFRGFLFCAMSKDSIKAAVIVSSVTFGIGHIIRLFNGSGAELIPNLIQVSYAIAAGFMFVAVFYKSKSLIPCIATHSLFNAFSAFCDENILSMNQRVISGIILIIISGGYAVYLALSIRKEKETETE